VYFTHDNTELFGTHETGGLAMAAVETALELWNRPFLAAIERIGPGAPCLDFRLWVHGKEIGRYLFVDQAQQDARTEVGEPLEWKQVGEFRWEALRASP
jgi:hypothetical protein